jgi:hypothetical protein
MKRRLLGFALAALTFAACRGSVDRIYDDGALTGPDGAVPDVVTSTSSSSGSDGNVTQKVTDAATDGPPPATAPAQISGSVLGLQGTGLVLQNNGGDNLPIATDGAFSFKTTIPPGKPYAVTVSTQPSGPSQSCAVENASGTAAGVDISSVKVTCTTAAFSVGGTVTGLSGATGLVLQDNGGNDITVNADGAFSFANKVQSGVTYSVTVKTNPAAHTCKVTGQTGTVATGDVSTVVVNCDANSYTVGGNVSGLSGTLVLQNNGGTPLSLTANGGFAFPTPITSGGAYAVTVKTQPTFPPTTQTCSVSSGSGNVGTADITNVSVSCTTTKFTVGGNITGLPNGASGLTLSNNGSDQTAPSQSGSFSFTTPIGSGASYNVVIQSSPPGLNCSVSGGSGTVGGGAVTTVAVSCATTAILSENFDEVAAPALPTGWTTDTNSAQATTPFATVTDMTNSAPNACWIEDLGFVREATLTSPSFNVTSGTAKVTFWHHFDTEAPWDGGALEISIAGGPFQDIIDAGGSFSVGGYTLQLATGGQNPMEGRNAWSGGPLTIMTTANLPANAAGQAVQLRWHSSSDNGASGPGWWIDDVVVTN